MVSDSSGSAPLRPAVLHPHMRGGEATSRFPPLRGLLPLALLLVVWEMFGNHRSPYFPPPSRWIRGITDLWNSDRLLPATLDTLGTFLVALIVATALGSLLGLAVGASRRADQALGPTLEFLRVMPPAAVVPIAALLIGYEERMKVLVVTLSAMWPILLNTKSGVHGLNPTLRDVARSLHLGRLDRLRKVTLPALLPAIFLGVRVAAPVALVITLLVEFLTQLEGLGALMGNAQRTYRSAEVYGLLLLAGLFSVMVNGMVSVLESRAFRNRPTL